MPICPKCFKWYLFPIYCITPADKPYWSTPRCPTCHEDVNEKTINLDLDRDIDKAINILEECLKILWNKKVEDERRREKSPTP